MCFDSAKSTVFKKELCKQLCENEENNSKPTEASISMAIGDSSKLFEFYEDIEDVKLSQLMNNEVIESLSKLILHITSVMSEFQGFMDKNKSNSCEAVSTRS